MSSSSELIFNEYFSTDPNLSNLNSWMIGNVNQYYIIENDVLDGAVTSFTYSNIVKNNDIYSLERFDDTNAKHFIPYVPDDSILDDHKNNIINIFNIYQFYDHLINNPNDISKTSITLNLYNYFDLSVVGIDVNNTKFSYNTSESHYNKIIVNNDTKDKLTMSALYTCRGIYLVLLYKYIADVYLNYYDECTGCDINTLMDDFKKSITKSTLFSNYRLDVTYRSDYLIIDQYTAANTFFDTLDKDHIIYNKTQNKYITITSDIDKVNDKYNVSSLSNEFNENDKCIILSKKSDYAAFSYNNTMNGIRSTNNIFNENKTEYEKSITNYEAVNGSFNNIDYIYYLTFIIVAIVLISIVATNSEQSRRTRVFIILIIIVLIYIMIFSYIEIAKRLAESFTTENDKQRETNILNNRFAELLTLIYTESSTFGMIKLYDKLTNTAKNELNNISKNNKVLLSTTDRNEANTNSEWHRLFQRTLFIHTVFLFLIIILTYLWLSNIIPDSNIYILIITIIFVMVLIFYYFKNLHRVVRSEYKHKYWTKMDFSK